MQRTPQHILDGIVADYLAGATAAEASAKYGKHSSTCLSELRRRGIEARKWNENRAATPEQLDLIVEAYLSGVTAKEAAALFGFEQSVCLCELKRRGVEARKWNEGRAATSEQLDAMIRAYLSGKSAKDAAALFGFNQSVCLRELKRRGIEARAPISEGARRQMVELYLEGATAREAAAAAGCTKTACLTSLRQAGIKSRKIYHSVDEDYFATIDTEEKAYWLGMLSADGCNHRRTISLGLDSKDKEHVEAFAKAISSTVAVRTDPQSRSTYGRRRDGSFGFSSSLSFTCPKMCNDLTAVGVTPRKSKTLQPWEGWNGPLARHYFRGLVDGDGWVSDTKGSGQWAVGLCGAEAVVKAFAEWGRSISGATAKAIPSGSIWKVQFGGRVVARRVALALYSDAIIALSRKALKARELMDSPSEAKWYNPCPKIDLPLAVIVQEYSRGMSLSQLASKYKVSTGVIADRLAEMGISRRSRAEGVRLRKLQNGLKHNRGDDGLCPAFCALCGAERRIRSYSFERANRKCRKCAAIGKNPQQNRVK